MKKEKKKVTGCIIVAAGKTSKRNELHPLSEIGSITVIKRIVLTFQNVGISPIVIITGYEAEEIERHLAHYGVIFLQNQNYENSQMLDSVKLGLDFLKHKCDQVIFTPVNIPMFTANTIQKMMKYDERIISPSYHGKNGHPLLISSELIPQILKYEGKNGMQGAIQNTGTEKKLVEVEDEGIIYDIDDINRLDDLLEKYNQNMLHPFVKISIEKETLLFNSRTKLLLLLIKETNSVRSACKHIALSYSKAWQMLNILEKELGYSVVERKHGGNNGGKTYLTKEGIEFLNKYEQFEENVQKYAKDEFKRLF